MVVKGNQPELLADIQRVFELAEPAPAPRAEIPDSPDLGDLGDLARLLRAQRVQAVGERARRPVPQVAQSQDLGHGRIEGRCLRVVPVAAAAPWIDWPGCAQVFRLERVAHHKKSGKQRRETVYGITSLPSTPTAAAQLLPLVRGHWRIENGSHWVRDVTFDEDRSTVRQGHLPQVLAALRNAVIGLLRASGATNIAASGRFYAAQPWQALALLGIHLEN